MRYLFLHGGPGFHSEAERRVLGPLFDRAGHEIVFWNEPSTLNDRGGAFRAEDSFAHALSSAKNALHTAYASTQQPVTIIAHSFAVHYGVPLALAHPDQIERLILVAPALDPNQCFRNLLGLAYLDAFRAADQTTAQQLRTFLMKSEWFFDLPMQQGIALAMSSPQTILHYWNSRGGEENRRRMMSYLQIFQEPRWSQDSQAQMAILLDFARHFSSYSGKSTSVPTTAVFGQFDSISKKADQLPALSELFLNLRVAELADTSHYLHYECPEQFLELIQIESSFSMRQPHENLTSAPAFH